MFKTLRRALLPALVLVLLFCTPQASMQGVRDGLSLWANAVLPALLPFYVVTKLLLQSGTDALLRPLLRPVCRLLGLPDALGGLLFMSWLSGAPNGARLLSQSCSDKAICTRFIACATVTGPLFLIGTVGQLLGSPLLGAMIYAIHLLAALCTGFCFRKYGSPSASAFPADTAPSVSVLSALPEALRSCALAMLFIGAAITFFSALTQSLCSLGLLSALQRILQPIFPADAVSSLFSGFFEVSQGAVCAAQGRLSLPLRLSLLCAFASFGGISVLCQAKVFLQQRVRTGIYFAQRVLHAVLSFFLCRGLCLLMSSALPAGFFHPAQVFMLPTHPFALPAAALCLLLPLLPVHSMTKDR